MKLSTFQSLIGPAVLVTQTARPVELLDMKLSRDICRSTPRFISQLYFAIAILLSASTASIFAAGGAEELNPASVPGRNLPYPVFTDVTASAGLQPTGFPFGNLVWGDFDGDGDLDVFVDNHYNLPP